MGKKGAGSWFTAVKRAFSSPTKPPKDDLHDKKRIWLFRKSSNNLPTQSATSVPEAQQTMDSSSVKQHFAATLIQTAFRGYLARRASRALKGIVMLQAVIRGQNVRNQASITFRCRQAILRVQSRLNIKPSKLSHPDSMLPYAQTPPLQVLDAILQTRKKANLSRDIRELQERANWLVRWMEAKQWESPRASSGTRVSIETDETTNSLYQQIPNSPSRRSSYGRQFVTPSPIKTQPLQVRSASPRYLTCVNGDLCRYSSCSSDMATPSYMAITESAKAKIRPQSSPRQTHSALERERGGSAKKRLSYPVQDLSHSYNTRYHGYCHDTRSPSFKSVRVNHVGMGQQSYYADSTGGEISPCSTTDLRK